MTVTETAPAVEWIPDADTFGARLILVRQRMGWGNVKQAAEECRLPVQSWRTWERDGVTPRRHVEVARTISRRTGCSFGWLLTGSSDGSIRTSAYDDARVVGAFESGTARPGARYRRPADTRPAGHPTSRSDVSRTALRRPL